MLPSPQYGRARGTHGEPPPLPQAALIYLWHPAVDLWARKLSGRGQPFDPLPQPGTKPETVAEWPAAAGAQLHRASGRGGQAGGSSGFWVCVQVTMCWLGVLPSSTTTTPAPTV